MRHLGLVMLGSGMQILMLFVVGAPLGDCYPRLWNVDVVAIFGRCGNWALLCFVLGAVGVSGWCGMF